MRGAVRRDEAQHDVRELLLHGGRGALAGVDAGHVPEKDPRVSFSSEFITSSTVDMSCRIVVVVAQPFSDVT